jgi:tRNA (guanine26-N2/guanine27-N2)-dimethyltransferase
MEFNRDVAVLALQAYQKMLDRSLSVCEPLAGCGIRGIRFAKEVRGVREVVINDINNNAFQLSNYNVQLNKLTEKIEVRNQDANLLLAFHGAPRKRFDVIDVDPFGSPVPFLDSAIRALRNGGLLMLTATDMAPLCGIHPKACIRKYGGKPLHTEYCQELAVRILSGSLIRTSAKLGMDANIVFSHSTNHYIRIYAILKHSIKKVNEKLSEIGYVFHCFECFHRETIKENFLLKCCIKCSVCGSKINFAGPLWLGRIANAQFHGLVEEETKRKPFKLARRIRRMLNLLENEVEAPVTYYVLDNLCSAFSLPVPSVKRVLEALKEEGFKAYLTHFNANGIKSNVSACRMKELLQEVVRG